VATSATTKAVDLQRLRPRNQRSGTGTTDDITGYCPLDLGHRSPNFGGFVGWIVQNQRMRLRDLAAVDVRPLLVSERQDLLALLRGLDGSDWETATAVPDWRVKDIALHVRDDDLGWLSRGRDAELSGLLDDTGDYRDFVGALARKNGAWVAGAYGLSQRVVCDLLEWSGREVDGFYAAIDLSMDSKVIWAENEPVPAWFDLARDLTERWVHQQQIRDALRCPGHHADKYLDVVLRTFVWAFPHQYAAEAESGTMVELDLGGDRVWTLTRIADAWDLEHGVADLATARVRIDGDAAWRVLTGADFDPRQVQWEGNEGLAQAALDVRGIIV